MVAGGDFPAPGRSGSLATWPAKPPGGNAPPQVHPQRRLARRASFTPPAPPARPKAPSSPTTTSPPTPSTCWPAGRSPRADRFLLALPLFHVHGAGQRASLLAGSAAAACACWSDSNIRKPPRTFLDFRPTLFFGVPTIYVRLLDLPPDTARHIGGFHAPVRFRLRAASGAGPRRVSRAVRPHHPGALRDERNAHEPQQSLRRRAARRHRGPAAAGHLGALPGRRPAARPRR